MYLGVCETPQTALIRYFFLIKNKYLLTVCDIMELTRNHKSRLERRYIYDTTKTTLFGRYF